MNRRVQSLLYLGEVINEAARGKKATTDMSRLLGLCPGELSSSLVWFRTLSLLTEGGSDMFLVTKPFMQEHICILHHFQ